MRPRQCSLLNGNGSAVPLVQSQGAGTATVAGEGGDARSRARSRARLSACLALRWPLRAPLPHSYLSDPPTAAPSSSAGLPLRLSPRNFPGFETAPALGLLGSDYPCPGSVLPGSCAFRFVLGCRFGCKGGWAARQGCRSGFLGCAAQPACLAAAPAACRMMRLPAAPAAHMLAGRWSVRRRCA